MSIQPKGDPIRKAVKWISEERQHDPTLKLHQLVERAAQEFNLNPKDVEFLSRLVKEELA
ncbi:MAG: hypothetical protein PVG19_07750 [Desulfobacterales bacterium]|jgi:hypothetical protein